MGSLVLGGGSPANGPRAKPNREEHRKENGGSCYVGQGRSEAPIQRPTRQSFLGTTVQGQTLRLPCFPSDPIGASWEIHRTLIL